MIEFIRMVVLVACLFAAYKIVGTRTNLGGWKKHGLAILSAFLVTGMFISATKTENEIKEERAQKAADVQAQEQRKLENERMKKEREQEELADAESAALETEINLVCQRAVASRLTVPKSADFSIMDSQITFDSKSELFVNSNTFEYKNAFNAELQGAYLCEVDASDFKSTKKVRVVNIKLGKK